MPISRIPVAPTLRLLLAVWLPALGCGGDDAEGNVPPTPSPSSNSALASLTTSLTVPLSPAFDPDATAYTIGPAVLPNTVAVTPTAEDDGAKITVNAIPVESGAASPALALGMGMTTVTVVVTAPDGSTRTYALAIDRTSAALTNLVASAGDLVPAFDPAALDYSVGPSLIGQTTTLTPMAEDPAATIAVNTVVTGSGSASEAVALPAGMTPVTVVVTARDGTTTSTYTVIFDRTLGGQQALLKAPNAEAMDLFGYAVALSGDTLVVGADLEDGSAAGGAADNSTTNSGAAYVFVRTGTTWSQQAYLKASNADRFDSFGEAVAISGDTVVVGAPFENGSATGGPADNSTFNAGAAYVFVRTGTSWSEQAYLKASNADVQDSLGRAVAISGDTVVVGVFAEDSSATGGEADNSAMDAGAAYVFVRTATTWSQQALLKASNAEAFDWFGRSVALSGDTLVVGAPLESSSATGGEADNSARNAGAAYVFVRTATTWSRQAYLKASNAETDDQFGYSVALSGDTLVVSASQEDSSAAGGEADNSMNYAGAAYVFVRSGTTWSQQAFLKASNAGPTDRFGDSVALSGDTLLICAPSERSSAAGGPADDSAPEAGAAYVFVRSGTTWSQHAYLKASNAEAEDRAGQSVALSGDTVVVGAWGEDSTATGGEADNSAPEAGAVYVYR